MKFVTLSLLCLCFSAVAEERKTKLEFKKTLNQGARNIDQETRKIIKNGKDVLSGKKTIKKND